jgi:ankyrin repeat protein
MAGTVPIADIQIDACALCLLTIAGESPLADAECVPGVTALPCNHTNNADDDEKEAVTPDTVTVREKNDDDVARLLSNLHAWSDRAIIVASGNSLTNAACRGEDALVACLLAFGDNVHAENEVALRGAAKNGHDAVVARLLAAGADVHSNDDWALIKAAENGHDAVVARLIAAGADVDAHDGMAICLASYRGHAAVVSRLIAADAKAHAQSDGALRAAALHGHDAVVALLRAAQ